MIRLLERHLSKDAWTLPWDWLTGGKSDIITGDEWMQLLQGWSELYLAIAVIAISRPGKRMPQMWSALLLGLLRRTQMPCRPKNPACRKLLHFQTTHHSGMYALHCFTSVHWSYGLLAPLRPAWRASHLSPLELLSKLAWTSNAWTYPNRPFYLTEEYLVWYLANILRRTFYVNDLWAYKLPLRLPFRAIPSILRLE